MKNLLVFLLFALLASTHVSAQALPAATHRLDFRPVYVLPGNAAQTPGTGRAAAVSRFSRFQGAHQAYLHVNQPLAACVYAHSPKENRPRMLLTFANARDDNTPAEFTFGLGPQADTEALVVADAPRFQQYWFHVVATFDGQQAAVYVNGKQQAAGKMPAPAADDLQLDIAASLAAEPYMQLGNVIRSLHLYDQPLEAAAVQARFEATKSQVDRGELYPGLFHFNAGPYLNFATHTSVNLLWEANLPAHAEVWYGPALPLTMQAPTPRLSEKSEPGYEAYIHETTLEGLEPHSKYFYEVRLKSYDGDSLSEARPHINDRIAKLVWGERPDFAINLGDLTDGGQKGRKWQWNYEYFEGMTQLHSRLPLFPVAGNGESDLYWYEKYHVLPGNEAYYAFDYGNARFFMLNSNRRSEQFAPGGEQYLWLEEQLRNSAATWNFVALHHAPYSTDENDYGDAWKGDSDLGDLKVRPLVPLFEKYGVDIVFFGHLHSYSRMGPIYADKLNRSQGVWYVQAGGAGGNLEDFAPTRAWFAEKVYAGHHYCLLHVSGPRLSFRMYDTEGRLRDYFEVEKTPHAQDP